MIQRIQIDFYVPVKPTPDQYQQIVKCAKDICDSYEAENPDRVMWPSGIGDLPLSNPFMVDEDHPMEFDETVFHVECFEREK